MSIEIKDVVAITGQPGLYKILKSDDKAILVESIDERKKRQLIKGNMLLSKIQDISIYTEDDSEPLIDIINTIKEKYGKELPVKKKSSQNDLMGFLEEVLPTYDKERVYASNVKKLVGWYNILMEHDVDLTVTSEEDEKDAETKEETAAAEAPATEESAAEAPAAEGSATED